MTDLQKQTIKTIVNIFETGRIAGDYSAIGIIPGDAGHLSYGRSQSTLGRGTLADLLNEYCRRTDAKFATALHPYLARVENKDYTLDNDAGFRAILKQAGSDPAMQSAQDDFFDRAYFIPACTAAAAMGVVSPLGTAVVYDSLIQGGWRKLKAQFPSLVSLGGEACWIPRYIALRRPWLETLPAPLPATVYRMDMFSRLIGANNWGLALPIEVRGITVPANILLPRAA